jgi:hypothetical protein
MPISTNDTTNNGTWLRGFGQGKGLGARLHADFGPLTSESVRPRDQLRRALSEVVVRSAVGDPIDDGSRNELRRIAVQNRASDWDASALATIGYLAEHCDDQAARSWLPVMLAEAGRYREAVDLPLVFDAAGRPPASSYVILVSAYALLGRQAQARDTMAALRSRFRSLDEDFVTVWDQSPKGRRFAELSASNPSGTALPVFFHLPFSGGTSMIVSLKATVPWAAIIEVGRRLGLYQIERALRLTADETADLQLVHLHHPYPLAVAGRSLSYFTVLRDPVSQLASGYYKRRNSNRIVGTTDATSATFDDHAEYTMAAGLTNMLTRQLIVLHPDLRSAYGDHFRGPGKFRTTTVEETMHWFEVTRNLDPPALLRMARETLEESFHLVGSMRHLAASHLAAAAGVGLPVAKTIVHRGRSDRPAETLSPSLEQRLRRANAVDQTLYEEYTERFEREYADLITAVEDS